MKLVICDDPDLKLSVEGEHRIIKPDGRLCRCLGCFGCWLKTPGKCVIADGYEDLGALWGHSDEAIVISRCVYGGLSPFAKNVFDRSIGYVHPDFRRRGGEMHHRRRYGNTVRLSVYFYGETSDREKETARRIMSAVAENFGGCLEKLEFTDEKLLAEGLKL